MKAKKKLDVDYMKVRDLKHAASFTYETKKPPLNIFNSISIREAKRLIVAELGEGHTDQDYLDYVEKLLNGGTVLKDGTPMRARVHRVSRFLQ